MAGFGVYFVQKSKLLSVRTQITIIKIMLITVVRRSIMGLVEVEQSTVPDIGVLYK